MNGDVVSPDGAGLQRVGDGYRFLDVIGEHSGCQTVRCVIRSLDSFIYGLELEDRLYRSKDLQHQKRDFNVQARSAFIKLPCYVRAQSMVT